MTDRPYGLAAAARSSQLLRVLVVGALVLLLQVPIALIHGQITDRQATRDSAVAEVTSRWGGAQQIHGPVLRVPFRARRIETQENGATREVHTLRHATFLPDQLEVTGDAEGETRYRGIYEVPVYRADLEIRGRFSRPDFAHLDVAPGDVLWERARLLLSVGDARALRNRPEAHWGEATIAFEPGGDPLVGERPSLQAHLGGGLEGEAFEFRIPLVLNGATSLAFAPMGADTRVQLTSNWPDPSFQGGWLPTRRSIDPDGFDATWEVSHLGRGYPQQWRDGRVGEAALRSAEFGVSFLAPVDPYRMALRSVKYEVLFLALPFLALWLFEVLAGLRVHPLQYLFVGSALCLFFLLQLSLAEHLGFLHAYGLAAAAVSLLVTAYSRVILGARRRAAVIGGVVAALYGYLYVLLQEQDYALLVGSFGLFVALAVVMWTTRAVDWYGLEARLRAHVDAAEAPGAP